MIEFPHQDFRFEMGMSKGDPRRFYQSSDACSSLLQQRRRWLEEDLNDCLVYDPAGEKELVEASQQVGSFLGTSFDGTGGALCRHMAETCGPDFLLLKRENPVFTLRAGSVCFPSFWAVREKMGLAVSEIHEIVPTLNKSLGMQIAKFLDRLPPGISFERVNWGLARTPEWNCHPKRNPPRLKPPFQLEEVFLRIEYQSFLGLPETKGVLFGIRLAVHPIGEVIIDLEKKKGLIRALESMPQDIAIYKGLAEGRSLLLKMLG